MGGMAQIDFNPPEGGVLVGFVSNLELKGVDFLPAFRDFLSNHNFCLPPEAQAIDRFLSCWCDTYANKNPNNGLDSESLLVLAFSLIMLSTDRHSPAVVQRLSFEDFKRNLRGCLKGKDFDAAFLKALYEGICEQRIRLGPDVGDEKSERK